MAATVAAAVAAFGRLDMAFNNAANQISYAGLAEEEAEDFARSTTTAYGPA